MNFHLGSNECIPCPEGYFCSIGCSNPIPSDLYSTSAHTITYPEQMLKSLSTTYIAMFAAGPVLLLFLAFILVWLLKRRKSKNWDKYLSKFDIFFAMSHFTPINSPAIKRKTRIGGAMSLLVIGEENSRKFSLTVTRVLSCHYCIFYL